MRKTEHNNNLKTPANGIRTIGELREFIKTCDIPAWEVGPIRSALKKADRLIGHGNFDLPADPALVMERLEKYSAAMASMAEEAWANLKSRIRKAFRLAEPRLAAAVPIKRLPLIPE